MATLSREQIASYAKSAGFPDDLVPTMVAIALAESGGRTEAHADDSDDDSYGLWQINMIGSLGPGRRKQFGLKADKELLDPTVNARAAYAVYKSQGLKAWTTYTSGKYKSHLQGGSAGGETATDTSAPTAATGLTGALNALGDTLFKAGSNIGGIIVAIALVVLGVVILMRNTVPVGKIAKLAGKVVK
jgi:hypothetical protein